MFFELAAEPANVQNIVHTMSGENAIGIQNLPQKDSSELELKILKLEARVQLLEDRIQKFDDEMLFYKSTITKLLAERA